MIYIRQSHTHLEVADPQESKKEVQIKPSGAKVVDEAEAIISDDDCSDARESMLVLPTEAKNVAQWAFGPNGIRSLRVIICGYFTETSYKATTTKLCRNERAALAGHGSAPGSNYRQLEKGDAFLWRLIEKCSTALQACPPDSEACRICGEYCSWSEF